MPMMTKLCKCCGKPFETTSTQKMFCDRPHYLPCPVCGKLVLKKDNKDFTRPPECCSIECRVKKKRDNLPLKKCAICGDMFKPKSGVSTICDKEHIIPCAICGKDMIVTKKMWHDKVDTCSKECAKEKLRRFYREKYGVDHPMQSSQVQLHHSESMKAKYGVEHALQNKDILDRALNTNLEKFGIKFACLRPECKDLSPVSPVSRYNKRYEELLTNSGWEVTFEKKLGSRSFDLCIESIKTVIEIDPTYTHNSYGNHWGSPVSKEYQKQKTDIALENGYRCIHVFEWDKTEKIMMLLSHRLKIGARKCDVRDITKNECDEFLNNYHIQGTVRGQLIMKGLFYNDELVQVMTFGKSRFDKSFEVELLRLCTKPGLEIVGGANKLFQHAVAEHPEWQSIVSYCDLSKFSGTVYEKLGMRKIRTTPPQAIWSKGSQKVTSMLLRRRGYDQLFKTNYGKGTSNEQLMIDNGWLPVYDCGQAVYSWSQDDSVSADSTSDEVELVTSSFSNKQEERKVKPKTRAKSKETCKERYGTPYYVNSEACLGSKSVPTKKTYPERKCAYCGKPFIPKTYQQIYCDGPHYMTCPVCGKEYLVTNNDKLKYPPTACSYECRHKKAAATNMDKYGSASPLGNSEVRTKIKQVMKEKYGVEYAMSSKGVQQKSKETLVAKYGVDNIQKSKDKHAETMSTLVTNRRKRIEELFPIKPFRTDFDKEDITAASLDLYVLNTAPCREFLAKYGFRPIQNYSRKHLAVGLVKNNTVYQCVMFEADNDSTCVTNFGSKILDSKSGYMRIFDFAEEFKGVSEFNIVIPEYEDCNDMRSLFDLTKVAEEPYSVFWKEGDILRKMKVNENMEDLKTKLDYVTSYNTTTYSAKAKETSN